MRTGNTVASTHTRQLRAQKLLNLLSHTRGVIVRLLHRRLRFRGLLSSLLPRCQRCRRGCRLGGLYHLGSGGEDRAVTKTHGAHTIDAIGKNMRKTQIVGVLLGTAHSNALLQYSVM